MIALLLFMCFLTGIMMYSNILGQFEADRSFFSGDDYSGLRRNLSGERFTYQRGPAFRAGSTSV